MRQHAKCLPTIKALILYIALTVLTGGPSTHTQSSLTVFCFINKHQEIKKLRDTVVSVHGKLEAQDTNTRLSKKFILEMVLMLYPTANTFSILQVS